MQLERLILQVKQENPDAQKQLYQLFGRYWMSICLRYNNSRPEALDVLQNALIAIYTHIRKFDPQKGQFKSWSSKIVVNENLMYLRKKSRFQEFENIEEADNTYSNVTSGLDNLFSDELLEMVQQLPIGYRTVFNLYVMDGMSHAEIAEKLNIEIGTSKSQLSKARKLLKQKIEVYF